MFSQGAATLNIIARVLMEAHRDKLLTQSDRDELYSRIKCAFGFDDWHPGMSAQGS